MQSSKRYSFSSCVGGAGKHLSLKSPVTVFAKAATSRGGDIVTLEGSTAVIDRKEKDKTSSVDQLQY